MAAKTSQQLQDMFANQADWSFEALQAAKAELQKRNIEPVIIKPVEISPPGAPASQPVETSAKTLEAIRALAEARKRKVATENTTESVGVQTSEIGMIPLEDHHIICGACEAPIDRDITSTSDLNPTGKTCPNFCSICETWFHPICLPDSCGHGEHLHCPVCGEKARLTPATFYCPSCASAVGVTMDSTRLVFRCSRCKKNVSLAALYFAGTTEVCWLIAVGVLSLVAFIVACATGASRTMKLLTGILAACFALPWALCLLSAIVQGMMPMGINIGSPNFRGNIDGIPLRQFRAFKRTSHPHRLLTVYGWLIVNSLLALVILLIGCAIIYFLTNWMEPARGK